MRCNFAGVRCIGDRSGAQKCFPPRRRDPRPQNALVLSWDALVFFARAGLRTVGSPPGSDGVCGISNSARESIG